MEVYEIDREARVRGLRTDRARARLAAEGIIDPRLEPGKHKDLFDATRVYDAQLLEMEAKC